MTDQYFSKHKPDILKAFAYKGKTFSCDTCKTGTRHEIRGYLHKGKQIVIVGKCLSCGKASEENHESSVCKCRACTYRDELLKAEKKQSVKPEPKTEDKAKSKSKDEAKPITSETKLE